MVHEVPSPHDPHVRHLRWMFLAVVTGSFLFLIPWIGYLSASLPDHHEVDQWRFAWVGFDGALIVAIGVTALCAWRRLQIFIPWALVTAALLCCDAWFDIVLDWNSDELAGAILTAALAELPLAALLVYVARKMIRLTVLIAWRRAGRTGAVPPLSRLTLVRLTTDAEPGPACGCGPGHAALPTGAELPVGEAGDGGAAAHGADPAHDAHRAHGTDTTHGHDATYRADPAHDAAAAHRADRAGPADRDGRQDPHGRS
ncbi:hypothetical protein [Actinacidiphila reveromycinica]|nr:hypothetical protein [Streptomyces sp. SN-593]